jgi:hypothetical protein
VPVEKVDVFGYPGAPGVVEGIARVITAIDNIGSVETGAILVTGATGPAWTPVFSRTSMVAPWIASKSLLSSSLNLLLSETIYEPPSMTDDENSLASKYLSNSQTYPPTGRNAFSWSETPEKAIKTAVLSVSIQGRRRL